MSEARERFNMFIENENTDAETIIGQAVIYISELEQQVSELKITISKRNEEYKELLIKSEQQNK